MNAFRSAVEAGDLAALEAALHPDVTFRSPAVFSPYEGRPAVMKLLATVFEVFEDFRYTDELDGAGTHVLVFAAHVGDKQLQGIDHLTVDDDGLVTELMVMIRPLSGLIAVAQEMGSRLEAAA